MKSKILEKHWVEFLKYAKAENIIRVSSSSNRSYMAMMSYDETTFWRWYVENKL